MESDESGSRAAPLLPEFGLYYPYIHFRSERWLKVAALYWPKLARVVPPGYQTRDSELVQKLNEYLGFVIDLTPELVRAEVARSFSELLDGTPEVSLDVWRIRPKEELAGDIRATPPDADRLDVPPALVNRVPMWPRDSQFQSADWVSPRRRSAPTFAGIHRSELDRDLETRLLEDRLAVESRVGWLAMEPDLAWLYKCHFTAALARRNRLTPITDQLPAHAAVAGLETGAFLAPKGPQSDIMPFLKAEDPQPDIATRFGLLALETVIPANLDVVPVEKIIAARQELGPEFDRWRRYAAEVGATLAEQLRDIESPVVLKGYLEEVVRSYVKQPMEDLRRGLLDVGLDAALTAMNTGFELPIGVTAAGFGAAPPVAAVPGIAATVINLRRTARAKAHATKMAPVAYLLNLHETLADTSFLRRIADMMRQLARMRR